MSALESKGLVLLRAPQRVLLCLVCGQDEICARGLCRRCYDAAYHDDCYFAGALERVLARDGFCCRVCGTASQVVHHRRPGVDLEEWLITLCPACHATVEHLDLLDRYLPPLLQLLWEEKHPAVAVRQWTLSFEPTDGLDLFLPPLGCGAGKTA
jgi:hypothetical protein